MPDRKYWTALSHNGVAFPSPYVPIGLKVEFGGERFSLSPMAEEMAYAWAKRGILYVEDPVFVSNFQNDFSRELPMKLRDVRLQDIDFSEFFSYIENERRRKELITKDEKKKIAYERKKAKELLKDKYGYAEVDGNKAEIQNWMIEPPGIFVGRGAHPFRGRWKPIIESGDVTINLGVKSPIPPGEWGGIIHDPTCMWLASWKDKLSGKVKYVWPHESTSIAQHKNKLKYDNAAKLSGNLEKVRNKISKGLDNKDSEIRKIATVCYLIDRLCLRVGDEKDEDEADTVGATTLRVEHVRLEDKKIQFDFLGKDSVRWLKILENVDPVVMNNLERFIERKDGQQPVFDGITSSKVNGFLCKVVPGLTAKVFRTFHATSAVRDYLWAVNGVQMEDDYTRSYHAKMANLKAAILCNHKRTPPKSWDENIKKKEERLETLKSDIPTTKTQADRQKARIRKAELALDIARKTKEYNLNTSLKNYIDPRVYKAWADSVGFDWRYIYPKTMQRKFGWVNRSKLEWVTISVMVK